MRDELIPNPRHAVSPLDPLINQLEVTDINSFLNQTVCPTYSTYERLSFYIANPQYEMHYDLFTHLWLYEQAIKVGLPADHQFFTWWSSRDGRHLRGFYYPYRPGTIGSAGNIKNFELLSKHSDLFSEIIKSKSCEEASVILAEYIKTLVVELPVNPMLIDKSKREFGINNEGVEKLRAVILPLLEANPQSYKNTIQSFLDAIVASGQSYDLFRRVLNYPTMLKLGSYFVASEGEDPYDKAKQTLSEAFAFYLDKTTNTLENLTFRNALTAMVLEGREGEQVVLDLYKESLSSPTLARSTAFLSRLIEAENITEGAILKELEIYYLYEYKNRVPGISMLNGNSFNDLEFLLRKILPAILPKSESKDFSNKLLFALLNALMYASEYPLMHIVEYNVLHNLSARQIEKIIESFSVYDELLELIAHNTQTDVSLLRLASRSFEHSESSCNDLRTDWKNLCEGWLHAKKWEIQSETGKDYPKFLSMLAELKPSYAKLRPFRFVRIFWDRENKLRYAHSPQDFADIQASEQRLIDRQLGISEE